jgi:hypothetical protein
VSPVKRDLVILACAISAGIHGALVPEHFAEGAGPGIGFILATALLAAVAIGITLRSSSDVVVAGAAFVFAGLLASYLLATTTGLPLFHPESEPVDRLALAAKAIEAVGLLAAASLLWRPRAAARHLQLKGTPT